MDLDELVTDRDALLAMDWAKQAECEGVDIELFFPARSSSETAVGHAVRFCRVCPVLRACAAWALEVGQTHGVAGGVFLPGYTGKAAEELKLVRETGVLSAKYAALAAAGDAAVLDAEAVAS